MLGELCKIIFPISDECYIGNLDSSIAICTLSSMDLLKKISNSELLNHISIAGRLFSENKGIDSLITYVNQNKKIKTIIVCGREVIGHKAGHSLFELHKNGIDNYGRIINSTSPDPFLTVTKLEINYFQREINLVNKINETNFHTIKKLIT
jgi:tetrahydromethanopterin S-methyltransferase subunit A